ncbi:MAG: GNAT family N-acetyltransferase [Caulobacter sp.]|nr:GNAT family N-acetyltransferase [Caulobacter sp.]
MDIIGADALTPSERALWLEWIAADPVYESPFFHPDFTAIAGQVAPGARLAVLHQGGKVVGFLPHQRRGGAAQPLAAPLNDYHGVIAAPGQQIGLDAAPDLLEARSFTATGWAGPARAGGPVTRARTLLADVSAGWDTYYAARKAAFPKFLKDKERARRSLERDLGPVRVETTSSDLSHFDRLIALKQDQYRRSRRHDIFDCGWTVELLRALMTQAAPTFGARLAVLYAGDRPMAYELGLRGGGHYHFWVPAYEEEGARYSPGMLLSMDTMKAGAAEGVSLYDFGFEGEAYKKYFCDLTRTVFEGPALSSGLSAGLARTMSEVVSPDGGRGLVPAALAQSVRRRWAVIDACETTTLGRVRALGAAASAMAGRGRNPLSTGALLAATLCCL